jgi:hypothetical protein
MPRVSTTISRISSAETSSVTACGSPPTSRTTRFVDTDSSQMTGRMSVAKTLSGGARIFVKPTERCMARRLGTSSPRTRERYAITRVMPISAEVSAAAVDRPARSKTGATSGASVEAP